jgi:hypothetical protein
VFQEWMRQGIPNWCETPSTREKQEMISAATVQVVEDIRDDEATEHQHKEPLTDQSTSDPDLDQDPASVTANHSTQLTDEQAAFVHTGPDHHRAASSNDSRVESNMQGGMRGSKHRMSTNVATHKNNNKQHKKKKRIKAIQRGRNITLQAGGATVSAGLHETRRLLTIEDHPRDTSRSPSLYSNDGRVRCHRRAPNVEAQ